MTIPQNDTDTPEARAEAAARDLSDRGLPVTARAVRSAAGVRMSIASETAKAWNDAAAETDTLQVPDAPQDVTARLAAIWNDAYRAAHTAFIPERDRLAKELKAARADVTSLTDDMVTVENERDRLADTVTKLKTIVDATEERIAALSQTTRDAELRLEATEWERDRLANQVDALIACIPATQQETAQEPAEAAPKNTEPETSPLWEQEG